MSGLCNSDRAMFRMLLYDSRNCETCTKEHLNVVSGFRNGKQYQGIRSFLDKSFHRLHILLDINHEDAQPERVAIPTTRTT